MNDAAEIIAAAHAQGFGAPPSRVTLLASGGNNVVARVEDSAGAPLCAKLYFTHAADRRDRLGTEFDVLTFLWRHGIRCVPQPIARDDERRVGFYSWIDGRRPKPSEVTAADTTALADLLGSMWQLRAEPGAEALPSASDAAFSLADYLRAVAVRLELLAPVLDAADGAARDHLRQLRSALGRAQQRVRAAAETETALGAELPRGDRALSPADHGFANALRISDGSLVFVDFEYAGWDDPAQMTGNACLQPEVPLPPDYQGAFVRQVAERLERGKGFLRRLRLVYPLLALKWSLIMLNEFLPVASARRAFAGHPSDARRAEQLEKSRALSSRVEAMLASEDALGPLLAEAQAAIRG